MRYPKQHNATRHKKLQLVTLESTIHDVILKNTVQHVTTRAASHTGQYHARVALDNTMQHVTVDNKVQYSQQYNASD